MKDDVVGEEGESGMPKQFCTETYDECRGTASELTHHQYLWQNKLEFNLAFQITNKAIFKLQQDDFVRKDIPG